MTCNFVLFLPYDYIHAAYNGVLHQERVDGVSENFSTLMQKSPRWVKITYGCYRRMTASRIGLLMYRAFDKLRRLVGGDTLPMLGGWTAFLWLRYLRTRRFEQKRPLCVVLTGAQSREFSQPVVERLRKRMPDTYFVMNAWDVHKLRTRNIAQIAATFDLTFTFDRDEAARQGILYYPLFFSFSSEMEAGGMEIGKRMDPAKDENPPHRYSGAPAYSGSTKGDLLQHGDPKYDLSFVGAAKSRLGMLIEVYDRLTAQGARLAFYLQGVPEAERVQRDGIHYTAQLDHATYMEIMADSACVLDVYFSDISGFSLRVLEAIDSGKKILSNCATLAREDFFDPANISLFTDVSDIDVAFVQRAGETPTVYHGLDRYTPEAFLRFVEEKLAEKAENG